MTGGPREPLAPDALFIPRGAREPNVCLTGTHLSKPHRLKCFPGHRRPLTLYPAQIIWLPVARLLWRDDRKCRRVVGTTRMTHKRHRRIPWMGRSSPLAKAIFTPRRGISRSPASRKNRAMWRSMSVCACRKLRLDAGSRNEKGRGCGRRPPHAQQRGDDRRTI